ncbi:MAG: lysine--tRNA ligase [Elusimicrobiota bacterium]
MENNPINEIIKNNYDKIRALKEKNIDPFPRRFEVKNKISSALSLPEGENAVIAGRIVLMRVMGKATFAHLKDGTGKMQIYARKDALGDEAYEVFKKNCHVGDFVGVEGKIFKTHTGEITVNASKITVLSKSVRPLPEKWHGITDPETRYRERYLDLIAHDRVKEIFVKRAKIISIIRNVLDSDGYIEVETPVLCSQAGGASARPFITFHNVYKTELYMRIATELPLKKLIIGGYDGVYEIGRVFRNEGIDTRHNPEFTTLEAYKAYADYNTMASLVEKIFEKCCENFGFYEIEYDGIKLNLKPPFERIYLPERWKQKLGCDIHEVLSGKSFNKQNLYKLADSLKIEYDKQTPSAKIFDRILDERILNDVKHPAFLMDYPTAITPLAKTKEKDESLVERFEFFIAGQEIANAYTELNDPEDQKSRLMEQLKQRDEENNGEADILDKDFIEAMEYGMPPTGGIGIGIDRITMILTGNASIREVIPFPLLKPSQK